MPRLSASLLLCFLFTACVGTSESGLHFDLEPLHSLENVDLAYEGSLSSRGLPTSTVTLAVGGEGERVAMHCEIFATSTETVAALHAEEGVQLRAVRVEIEALEALREALLSKGLGRRAMSSEVHLGRGGDGYIAVTDEVAYVGSFELRNIGTSSIGDPSVGYAQDGFLLELRSEDGEPGTPCKLEIDLHFAELMRPLAETRAKLPGSPQEVTIQMPVFTLQKLHVAIEFVEDTALLVGPIPGMDGDEPLMVLLGLELSHSDS
jgi:hypothetical protein